MITPLDPRTKPAPHRFSISSYAQHLLAMAMIALALCMIHTYSAHGQTDRFDDGDDEGWTKFGLDVVGGAADYTFPDDGTGGQAYRIFTPAPPVPDAGPARAFSYRADQTYSDFYMAVDVLDFDDTLNQAFGFLVRAGNIGLGQTTGYVVNYDPNQEGFDQNDPAGGQFQINRVTDEQPDTLAVANVTLNADHRYRIVAIGNGPEITARIYDENDLTEPLITIVAEDDTYPTGVLGLFNFSRVDSDDYTNADTGKADVTFDNYVAMETPPAIPALPATSHGLPFQPQLVSHTPAALTAFHPAAEGFTFQAHVQEGTLTPAGVQVELNGADVTSQVQLTEGENGIDGVLSGLAENLPYEVAVHMTTEEGNSLSQRWLFDTFTQDFLHSDLVEVIEAEDYNYSSGQFQDNPPVSGFTITTGEQVRGSMDLGMTAGEGYLDAPGEADVDYHSQHEEPGGPEFPEYRINDLVGTQAGSIEWEDRDHPEDSFINDVRRQKYIDEDLPEYQVRSTRSGDWLNYTRNFEPGTYKVYLRVAAKADQEVHLERITSDASQPNATTERLGTFQVPNEHMTIRYRFVPLTDAQGNEITLDLEGTDSLRLLTDGPPELTRFTMVLNYMLFAPEGVEPAGPVLEGVAEIGATFQEVVEATLDPEAATVRVPMSQNSGFFRLRAQGGQLEIESVHAEGNELVIRYNLLP